MNPQSPSISSPARDGNIAIIEEYDAAVQQNTIEAFELFILRHPDRLRALIARQQRAGSFHGGWPEFAERSLCRLTANIGKRDERTWIL